MKKLLLLVICLQCSISVFTQSRQDKDIMQCINSLGKGDTIQLGSASGHFNYIYVIKNAGFGKGLNTELIKEDDLMSKKYIIKDLFITYSYVKNAFYTKTEQIISFGKKGGVFGVTYYADIYGAIESGEIIIKKCQNNK